MLTCLSFSNVYNNRQLCNLSGPRDHPAWISAYYIVEFAELLVVLHLLRERVSIFFPQYTGT